MTYAERVASGAYFLDTRFPHWDWTSAVDLDAIDMDVADSCVLGQIYVHRTGDEDPAWTAVLGYFNLSETEAVKLGFDASAYEYESSESLFLVEVWQEFITARRQPKTAPAEPAKSVLLTPSVLDLPKLTLDGVEYVGRIEDIIAFLRTKVAS